MPKRKAIDTEVENNPRRSRRLAEVIDIIDLDEVNYDIAVIPAQVDKMTDDENDEDVAGELEVIPSDEINFDVKGVEWNKDVPVDFNDFPNFDLSKIFDCNILMNKEPYEIFEMMAEGVFDHIAEESKRYAGQQNNHSFDCNGDDYRVFFSIILLSGYHTLQQQGHYWSDDEDLGIEIVKRAMPRNRFYELKRFLHCNNNNSISEDETDRYFKIRPLINLCKTNVAKFCFLGEKFAIDEKMVQYYGRNKLKQFIQGKPIRFGYKVWALCCSTSGYCYFFEPYQGRSTTSEPLGKNVVKKLSESVPPGSELYFDNFFTSIPLLFYLSSKSIKAYGTMRKNQLANCLDLSKLGKEERGTFDFDYSEQCKIGVTGWKDNRVVCVASYFVGCHPVKMIGRRQKGKATQVPIPQSLLKYNESMGGVDLSDWNIEKYRCSIAGKKWYFKIITYIFDMMMVNSWILWKHTHGAQMSNLEFRRQVVKKYLLLPSSSAQKHPGRPSTTSYSHRASDDIRLSGNHCISLTQNSRQRKCAVCKKQVRKECSTCDVGLHIECFSNYHS